MFFLAFHAVSICVATSTASPWMLRPLSSLNVFFEANQRKVWLFLCPEFITKCKKQTHFHLYWSHWCLPSSTWAVQCKPRYMALPFVVLLNVFLSGENEWEGGLKPGSSRSFTGQCNSCVPTVCISPLKVIKFKSRYSWLSNHWHFWSVLLSVSLHQVSLLCWCIIVCDVVIMLT